MKRYATLFISLVLLLSFAQLNAAVEKISYSGSWGQTGFNLEYQNSQTIQLVFSVNEFFLEDVQINGENMQAVRLPGIFLPNNSGAPDLSGTGRFIAVPQGATPSFRVVASRSTTIKNINIGPAPEIPLETYDGPLQYSKDQQIYDKDQFYPASPVQLSELTQIRGVDAVMLGVTPFQYNPVTRELVIYQDLRVEISFSGGNGHFGEDRLRSRWWDPLLRDIFLNQEALEEVEYQYHSESLTEDFEYLIITPDNPQYLPWADSIKVFRNRQGIRTGVVTLTTIGGNTTTAIENYINNAYNTWTIPPAAFLLMADYGTGAATGNGITSPVYNSYCISDHIYADVNGDHMAEMAMARLTAQNSTQLEIMVRKFLDYETNPPTNPNFYLHPITAMGWQTERWFQICSETINGFWEYALGKQPVRENAIYSGTPSGNWSSNPNTSMVVNYFGPSGLGYIPATPNHLNDWGGNATRINNDINSGAFMIQHRDHGYEQGWGEPAYSSSNLTALNNNDLIFIMSLNCLTGKFNITGDCFTEAAHRYPKRALGLIAASETSYSFVNDAFAWGMYDNMWPNFMPSYGTNPPSRGILPAFGNVAGKYFLQQSSWPYNPGDKQVTYYLFHHHGDAFSTVYSEMPQNLTVIHNAVLFGGQSSFTVTADQDALIALTVNDVIIGVATGTGAPVSITIPPQVPGDQMLVTVTKQNFYRYSQTVMITAATGPYLYCMNTVPVDTNLNNNGIPEAGETLELKLRLTNLGVQSASNITANISCLDTFLTVLNGNTTIPFVNIADTLIDGSFMVAIHENTPHLHHCTLHLLMAADSAGIPGGYQWEQQIPVVVRQGSRIELSSGQLQFVPTFLNFTSPLPLTIFNTGADTLHISNIASDILQFAVSATDLIIAPNSSQGIQVLFTPDDTLDYTGTLTIDNNDPVQFSMLFSAIGTGINAPDIQTLPGDTVVRELGITDSVVQRVTIENAGLGELVFNLQVAGWDPGTGEGAGGSDTYGHMWIDSDEPNGPTFDWIDISLTGTELALTGNNSISGQINIGFPFTFYGNTYNDLRVCTNGWLSFTTFSVVYNNVVLPSNLAPRSMIAPLWDDLNFLPDSKVYYENQGNKLVIMYHHVYRVTGEGPYTFEVILFDNDNVVLQYLDLQNLVIDYTVGIQNQPADDGLTIAHNEAYLHNNLAILISRATWASVSPMGGVLAGGASIDVNLTMVTHNFPEGEFYACLQIESNDPDEGIYVLPIHMTVSAVTGMQDATAEIPKKFQLYQNSPNPFNPTTVIAFNLPKISQVQLVIYNMLGQKVKTLVNGTQEPRQYKILWDGTNEQGEKVASGIYIYQLRTDEIVATKKMILMK